MLTEPLIRFFKYNLMLNKQNCDNMSEMKKKKNMDNYTPKKQSRRNITHQVILTETVRRFNKHCFN